MGQQDHANDSADVIVPAGRDLNQSTVEHGQIIYQVLQTCLLRKHRMNIFQELYFLRHQLLDEVELDVGQKYYEYRIEKHDEDAGVHLVNVLVFACALSLRFGNSFEA